MIMFFKALDVTQDVLSPSINRVGKNTDIVIDRHKQLYFEKLAIKYIYYVYAFIRTYL